MLKKTLVAFCTNQSVVMDYLSWLISKLLQNLTSPTARMAAASSKHWLTPMP
jgi:hypothetical protein